MTNHNTKNKIRNASLAAIVALGGAAVAEKTFDNHSAPKPVLAKPIVEAIAVNGMPDGSIIHLDGRITVGKAGDTIKSTSFKLVDPENLPDGVKIGATEVSPALQGELVTTTLTGPSNREQPDGEIKVALTAVESNGAKETVYEEVPYRESLPPQ